MPTIKQLREQTQRYKVEGRERPWGYRLLQRGPSIYITRLFINTNISPTFITTAGLLIGIAGAKLIFIANSSYLVLVGLFLGYLNILSDKVDGEIARYKKRYSLKGIYLDEINHLIVPPLYIFALTFYFARALPLAPMLFIALGILGAISMPALRINHSLASQMFVKKYLKNANLFSLPKASSQTAVEQIKKHRNILRFVLKFLHQFQEFFLILAVFFILFVIEIAFPYLTPVSLPALFLIFLGILLPLIVTENTIKGVLSIEKRVAELKERFVKTGQLSTETSSQNPPPQPPNRIA